MSKIELKLARWFYECDLLIDGKSITDKAPIVDFKIQVVDNRVELVLVLTPERLSVKGDSDVRFELPNGEVVSMVSPKKLGEVT